MAKINVLPKSVAELIAAGEVVERPSSAVKEMIENSIDAGATAITVEIKNGGVKYIRVTDNGCGIHREDVRTAFISHATSKIKTAEDLEGIETLGFRGEALAAIASVSDMRISSKTADAEARFNLLCQRTIGHGRCLVQDHALYAGVGIKTQKALNGGQNRE